MCPLITGKSELDFSLFAAEFLHRNLGTLGEKWFILQTDVYFGLSSFQLSVVTLTMSSQLEANLSSVSAVKELPTH